MLRPNPRVRELAHLNIEALVGMRIVRAHNKTLAVLGSSSAARVFDSNGPDPGDKSSMLRCASANAAWASTQYINKINGIRS